MVCKCIYNCMENNLKYKFNKNNKITHKQKYLKVVFIISYY